MHFDIVSIEIFELVILSREEQHKEHISNLQLISRVKKEHDLYNELLGLIHKEDILDSDKEISYF